MKLKTKKSLASAAKVIPLESLTFTYIFDFEANNLNFTISKSEKGRKTFSPVELLNYLSFGESFESLTDELYASFENFESAEDKKIESNYLERLNAGKLSLEVQNEVAQNMKDIIKKILTIPTASSDSLWKVEK